MAINMQKISAFLSNLMFYLIVSTMVELVDAKGGKGGGGSSSSSGKSKSGKLSKGGVIGIIVGAVVILTIGAVWKLWNCCIKPCFECCSPSAADVESGSGDYDNKY